MCVGMVIVSTKCRSRNFVKILGRLCLVRLTITPGFVLPICGRAASVVYCMIVLDNHPKMIVIFDRIKSELNCTNVKI